MITYAETNSSRSRINCLEHTGSWQTAVVHDLQWLHQICSKCQFLPCPALDFTRWDELVKNFPLWLGRVLDEWKPTSLPTHFLHAPVVRRALPSVECHLCAKVAKGRAALTQHLKKRHGIMPFEAYFVSNKWCPVCNKLFGCKSRVLQHLRHTLCGVSVREGACPLIDGPVFHDRDLFRDAQRRGLHLFVIQ